MSYASFINSVSFWPKFLSLLILIPIAAFLGPGWLVYILIGFALLLSLVLNVLLRDIWKSSRIYIISVVIAIPILSLIFLKGDIALRISKAIDLALRFSLLIIVGSEFSLATNPSEIPQGLLQAHFPKQFAITVMIAFRMLPLISKKIETISQAFRMRGIELEFKIKNLLKLPLTYTMLVTPIVKQTLEMSMNLYETLLARGYTKERSITVPPFTIRLADIALISISVFFLYISIANF